MRKEIFLENLPRLKNGNISWKNSVGHKVHFIYDDIEDNLEIINYISKIGKLTILYNNKTMDISPGHFTECCFGKILNRVTKEFKIEIGTTFKDEKRDITIIDREIRYDKNGHRWKYYKYHCNIDGNEDWVREESLLNQKVGCNVCSGDKVIETNCIWNTDRELCVMLGIPKEVAITATRGSNRHITFNCKCGNPITIMPSNIIKNKSIGCKKCSDGKSYPEKFIFSALDQSKEYFIPEYQPEYLKREENGKLSQKRNDFYLPNLNIVIEADGGLGHEYGKVHGKSNKTLEEYINVDKWKEEQNLKHGIKTIRIDCFESNTEYIKNNILNSELTDYIDFSSVDWNKCNEYAIKSIVKEVCDWWNNKSEEESTLDCSKYFKLNRTTVINYLKKGTEIGWCNYNPKEESRKGNLKSGKILSERNSKPILMYDKNMNFIGEYESSTWLSKHSEELFNVKLLQTKICDVCNNKRPHHRNYIFKYAD